MEQITSAIIAALVSGISTVGSDAVKDAYGALKGLLLKNLPTDSGVASNLKELEINPNATLPRERLNAELLEARVTDSSAVLALLATLIEKMNESEKGKSALSQFNIQAGKIGVVGDNITIGTLTV